MDAVSEELRDALVAAFEPYLSVVATRHDIGGAVAEGGRWLHDELTALLSQPFVAQRRAPLEVFREALRFPTAALEAAGVKPPPRPAGDVEVLPGDVFGIAPASSLDLGQRAWEANIAWGAAKAQALATVCWFGRDLADRSRVEAAVGDGRFVASPETLHGCGRIVIDLTAPNADATLREATGGGWPVVAYGPHADTAPLDEARRLGATAVPRSAFFRDPRSFVAGNPGERERGEG